MIAAALYPKGGVDKTARALRLVRLLARQGKRVTLIDAAPQGSAPDRSEQRARRRFDRLFGVIGLTRNRLCREPVLGAEIGQRVMFADAGTPATLYSSRMTEAWPREITALASRDRKACAMIARGRCGGFAARRRDAESWTKTPGLESSSDVAGTIYTAQLAIDIAPSLRERIKTAAFRRDFTVTDWLRDPPACEFFDANGDHP
jgi:hypothetical protein